MQGTSHMLFNGGFTFTNFIVDVFAIFLFILWFWLLVGICGDLFRRQDMSGLSKVLWIIFLIVLPYLGIFAYLLTQGRGMSERETARIKGAQAQLRQMVGFSAADEIEKLDRLKAAGSISADEYKTLRTRIMQ